ncbi:MAG: hypothetical protein K2N05_02235 [Muribaculaceae bacterium]|nr:hypothetical protein [Muribaculaceae bacterium]
MATHSQNKDRAIAAGITFLVVLLILVLLFTGGMNYQRAELAHSSTPEIMLPEEDEEQFIEPEILTTQGEPDATANDKPAPVEQGEPVQAPEENTKIVIPGDNPEPAPQIEKPITQKKESPVKATTPPATTEEKSQVASAVANKFSGKNGSPGGKTGSNGSGGTGVGVDGKANGRQFISCPSPSVSLRHQTTVKVSVVINAEGKVIEATASGTSDATIRRACEQAARSARWTPKAGAGETRGSITFTITPK